MMQNTMQARYAIQRPPVYAATADTVIDAFVNSENPYMNYCREHEMLSQQGKQVAFLSFSAPAVPEYGETIGAILKLNKLTEATCTLQIYASPEFDEYSLTWDNQPEQGELIRTITLTGVGEQLIDLSEAYFSLWAESLWITIAIEADVFTRLATAESATSPAFIFEYEDTRVAQAGMRTLPGNISILRLAETYLPGSVIIDGKNRSFNLPGSLWIINRVQMRVLYGSLVVRNQRNLMLLGTIAIEQYIGNRYLPGAVQIRRNAWRQMVGNIYVREFAGSVDLPGSIIVRANALSVLSGTMVIPQFMGTRELPGSVFIRAWGQGRLPGSIGVQTIDSEAVLPGLITVRENRFLPGSITLRCEAAAILYGYMEVRAAIVLPGSILNVIQPFLPGSIVVQAIGQIVLPGNIEVKARDIVVLPGWITVGDIAKGYVFIM